MVLRTLEGFLGAIVGFDGAGLDDDVGVTMLPSFTAGSDRAGDVTGVESDSGSKGGQGSNEDADNDFEDFLLGHKA